MSFAVRDEALRELMDDPSCDPARLSATLRRFKIVNRAVAGWGTVYRMNLRPVLATLGRPARVLDLGCGGADVTARLARLARKDGLAATWLAVDPDARVQTVAEARADSGVEFRCASTSDLLAAGEVFDIVISNHVLHHLTSDELPRFADDSRRLASRIVLHSDLARSRAAYGLYAAAITPVAPGTFLRTDGLRSIRRSYRPAELEAALPGWRIEQPVPFRLVAVADGTAPIAGEPSA